MQNPSQTESALDCDEDIKDILEPPQGGQLLTGSIFTYDHVLRADSHVHLPQLVATMRARQVACTPVSDYVMDYIASRNSYARHHMRIHLVQIMMDLTDHFFLGRETMHLGINYCDRYLAIIFSPGFDFEKHAGFKPPSGLLRAASPQIESRQIYLLAVTCVFMAAKYEEIIFPNLLIVAQGTGNIFTTDQIRAMESIVVAVLQWRLTAQTSYSWYLFFVRHTIQCLYDDAMALNRNPDELSDEEKGVELLAMEPFLQCMRTLEITVYHSGFFMIAPSVIAAATICLIHPRFLPRSAELFGLTATQLEPLVAMLSDTCQVDVSPVIQMDAKMLDSLRIPESDLYTRHIYSKPVYEYAAAHLMDLWQKHHRNIAHLRTARNLHSMSTMRTPERIQPTVRVPVNPPNQIRGREHIESKAREDDGDQHKKRRR